jgi:catechol 2,3-dioxygenase-like lactoylglutathione lyase family enzyme
VVTGRDGGPSEARRVSFNWIGVAVTDLDRSRRFYEELLGFAYQRQLSPPDGPTSQLCQVPPPVNLTAVYLQLDGFVLELLHFDRQGNPPATPRPMNQPGLTHLSVTVPNVRDVVARVPDYGGSVLNDTDLGTAVCIHDPDGQLIELLAG